MALAMSIIMLSLFLACLRLQYLRIHLITIIPTIMAMRYVAIDSAVSPSPNDWSDTLIIPTFVLLFSRLSSLLGPTGSDLFLHIFEI